MSSIVCCWVWDQIPKLHLSNGWAPEFSATINPLVRGVSSDLDSLATKPLQRLLVCLCYSELDGSEVSLTLWVLLAEMLGGAVLLIHKSDVILVTSPAIYAGVASEAGFPPIPVLARVHSTGPGVIGPAAQMVNSVVLKVTIREDAASKLGLGEHGGQTRARSLDYLYFHVDLLSLPPLPPPS